MIEPNPNFKPSLGCCNGIGFHTEKCPVNPGKTWSDTELRSHYKESFGWDNYPPRADDSAGAGT